MDLCLHTYDKNIKTYVILDSEIYWKYYIVHPYTVITEKKKIVCLPAICYHRISNLSQRTELDNIQIDKAVTYKALNVMLKALWKTCSHT